MAVMDNFRKAWNAFSASEKREQTSRYDVGPTSSYRPDRSYRSHYNDRSIITAIYTRLAIDVASIDIRHVSVDEMGRYKEDMQSAFNDCLTYKTNMDQSPRAFRQDIAETIFDRGSAVLVPVDTTGNPETSENFDILTMRVGEVVKWNANSVRANVYNELRGERQEIHLAKSSVAIAYNPLYSVMNEQNSTLQRLIRKLKLLDVIDEQSGSGKLDLIIQLPYQVKSDTKKNQANNRRKELESQLQDSQYGVAYADATEKITQLNRPAENNLMGQIEYLVNMLYGQLGLTEDIMNGTADEATMLNYYNRTIEPVVSSIVEALHMSFTDKIGSKDTERVEYFRDPFKLVPVKDIAEIADKFTRNEILSANEIRSFMGIPPSSDPKADKLINSNMPQPNEDPKEESTKTPSPERTSQDES